MFKEKTSKKRIAVTNNAKENSTLDVMHNKMIKTFAIKYEEKQKNILILDNLLELQETIRGRISDLSFHIPTEDLNQEYNSLWTSNIRLSEEIIHIKNLIKEANEFDEIDYYNKTSDILFNYYEMLESQSKIKNFYHIHTPKPASRSILDAFNNANILEQNKNASVHLSESLEMSDLSEPSDQLVHSSAPFSQSASQTPSISLQPSYSTRQTVEVVNTDKSALVDEYLFATNKHHIKKSTGDDLELCRRCKNQMTCLQHDAIIICDQCGYQELLLVEQNRPILKQNNKDTSHFSYKRINHFREWCNQVQGKESTDIPDEIFEKILNEIKKEKIIDTKTITYTKMREILKRLRINKYYEHINYIINRINGIPTPQFSPDLEEKLCNMFRDIQTPFLKHCPKDRKNFLSYSYVLYKFFQILGLNEYLKYFPLLKSREKLYLQDQIWKKICEELNYDFLPSF